MKQPTPAQRAQGLLAWFRWRGRWAALVDDAVAHVREARRFDPRRRWYLADGARVPAGRARQDWPRVVPRVARGLP